MDFSRRRWQQIDRKLPLLASGLVLLTAVVLGWTAYVRLEHALLQSAGARLLSTAQTVAQMLVRPNARTQDSVARATVGALRSLARGNEKGARENALLWLARTQNPMDTTRFFAAFVDTSGQIVVAYQRPPARTPRWAVDAIARRAIHGDTVSVGPFEEVAGHPVISMVRPLRESDAPGAPLIGYLVDARTLSTARGAQMFRNVIGDSVHVLLGQPGVGVWTDLASVEAPPPVQPRGDSIVIYRGGVGAAARVAGSGWLVWLSQPTQAVLAPARKLWWSMIPMGLLIALFSAGVMWRMAHSITYPIAALTEAVEGIAQDVTPLSVTQETAAELRNDDEVTRLRSAFDRMAARVKERESLEMQLRHAQKMEAVGRLAGGIAHDFNNLMTAIRSYADLMIDDMTERDPKRGDVEEIRKAAQRATALTAQLLAYSRKQMLQPKVIDSADVLNGVEMMLRRLLIEDIQLVVDAPNGIWPVKVDRGQLEQVIVNLAVNARDAMPHGGALRISARNENVTSPIESKQGNVPCGDYVVIEVTDTGLGMDAVTQSRVFEPFFTTKEVGQGTGLGLATVHGIVAQSGGYITVESAVEEGTTFAVYLPRVDEVPVKENGAAKPVAGLKGNNETILLVEDEASVRALTRRVLVRAGFRVLEATTPSDALRLAHEHHSHIRLVLSDVVMPEMSGPALVSKLAEVCPHARVLYVSGYTDDEVVGRGLGKPGMLLLQKPFSSQQLVDRVRAAIGLS